MPPWFRRARPRTGGPDRIPRGLRDLANTTMERLRATVGGEDVFLACFASCITTTVRRVDPSGAFIVTGDIGAMWHRDTRGQLLPYLSAGADPGVAELLTGACRTMAAAVLTDPYANAVNDGPTGARAFAEDLPVPGPHVWERKYEVDSLAAVLSLGYEVWRATGSAEHLDDTFRAAAASIVRLWIAEQDHDARSTYRFLRTGGSFAHDSLPRSGLGAPCAITGMTWSGFRPSDDRCAYPYLVPSNIAAVHALSCAAALGAAGHLEASTAASAEQLAAEITHGVLVHGRVPAPTGPVYAYEVDGLGNALLMDDANPPSLLSLPLWGWCAPDEPTYLRTRAMLLSRQNPHFCTGTAARGIGSPHTPPGYVWPLALVVQALTATDEDERVQLYRTLTATHAGTRLMHESFHPDAPERFTRGWFAWANSAFAHLAMVLAGTAVPLPQPPLPPGARDALGAAAPRRPWYPGPARGLQP